MANVSKLKIGTDTYDIKDTTARNNAFVFVSQSDFLTLNNGFSIGHYEVMANNNTVYGHITIKANSNFTSTASLPFTIKEGYRPINSFYKACFLGAGNWNISNIGYLFMGNSGGTQIISINGTYDYAIIDFIYQK